MNAPPPAAVVDGPRARERRHQQDAGSLHPQQQRQAPHRSCTAMMSRGMPKGCYSQSYSPVLKNIYLSVLNNLNINTHIWEEKKLNYNKPAILKARKNNTEVLAVITSVCNILKWLCSIELWSTRCKVHAYSPRRSPVRGLERWREQAALNWLKWILSEDRLLNDVKCPDRMLLLLRSSSLCLSQWCSARRIERVGQSRRLDPLGDW